MPSKAWRDAVQRAITYTGGYLPVAWLPTMDTWRTWNQFDRAYTWHDHQRAVRDAQEAKDSAKVRRAPR